MMNDKQRSILVVDDDVDICRNVRDILQEFGYRADVAHDGASAVKLVNRARYDVALLDFKMPDIDGAALYNEIKQVQPSLVAIMITAYAGSDGVQRAKDAGTWHVLRKPVDFDQLLPLIEQAANQPIVLVVDDDQDFVASLWSILREQGMRVACAGDTSAAIEILSDLELDIVLLDMHLGESRCTAVFEKLIRMAPMPNTVLISGDHKQQEVAQEMVAQGAHCLYLKPLDIESLLAKLKSLIAKR
jgi:DNA-binding NtrC family response regulator